MLLLNMKTSSYTPSPIFLKFLKDSSVKTSLNGVGLSTTYLKRKPSLQIKDANAKSSGPSDDQRMVHDDDDGI